MRTVIFGVDGLSFRILHPLIERGDLPNFARLQHEGVMADFISTLPFLTPPAWMSMVTGLKPAKHGVFDFFEFDTTSPVRKSTIVTHRKDGKAIWNILSEYGKRVVVMNVPFTYPPEAVNGIMVSGFMTPVMATSFTFPKVFKEELCKIVPDYRIDLPLQFTADSVLDMTEKRIRLQDHLLSEHEWDFAFLAYVGPDRIQHQAWDAIATLSYESTKYYRLLDDALGRVLNRLTPQDVLFVASDHGFVGAKEWFYINEYLRQRKLLCSGSAGEMGRAKFLGYGREAVRKLNLLGFTRKVRETYGRFYGKHNEISRRSSQPFFNAPAIAPIHEPDWNNTHACVLSPAMAFNGVADVYLSPDATSAEMEELRQALAAERHPKTGLPLAQAVYATDVFGVGPFRPPEEHIILVPHSGTTFHLAIGRPNLWETLDHSKGVHEQEGIFYAWGSGIRRGVRVDPLQICDLVPTVLHALHISAGEPFDGHVAQEIFMQKDGISETGTGEGIVGRKLRLLQMDETNLS